jgi:DNA-binding GntR family transcriptional regulator
LQTQKDRRGYRVGSAAEAIRELIARSEIGPGEQIHQAELAERLGVSRTPLREALRVLEREGLLVHEPNRSYRVVRLSTDELVQIYRMRTLLEGELLATLRRATKRDLVALRRTNAAIDVAVAEGSVRKMLSANRDFHFGVFQLSPLTLICNEVERLWRLCEPYHAAYLWHPTTRKRMVLEHDEMIEALAAHDRERLSQLVEMHRTAAETTLRELLSTQ